MRERPSCPVIKWLHGDKEMDDMDEYVDDDEPGDDELNLNDVDDDDDDDDDDGLLEKTGKQQHQRMHARTCTLHE